MYMCTVPKSEAEILNCLNLHRTCKVMDGSPPRTGIFHQAQATAGDTTCNVNGVQSIIGKKKGQMSTNQKLRKLGQGQSR